VIYIEKTSVIFISVINQLGAQNLSHSKFYFMSLYMFREHVLETCRGTK